MAFEPQHWLRHFRQFHGMTVDRLARRAGLSKVFVSKIERGERQPSAKSEQALADALGELRADVFPNDGRMTPQDVANYYVEQIRAQKHGVPESEFERDMRAGGIDPDEERRGVREAESIVRITDDDVLVIDGRRFNEAVNAIHIDVRPMSVSAPTLPRPREQRTRRKRGTASSSSSDDPGEPHLDRFAGADPPARELARAGAVSGQQAAPGAARSRSAL